MDINSQNQKSQKFISMIREDIIDNRFEYLISDHPNKFYKHEDYRKSSIFLDEILKTPNKTPHSPLLVYKGVDFSRRNSPIQLKQQKTLIKIPVIKTSPIQPEKFYKKQEDKKIVDIHKKTKQIQKLKTKKTYKKTEKKVFQKKTKSNKGLKSLSILVKNLLDSNESLSYNDVTNLIINSSIEKDSFEKNRPVNEKQNIKRRVYDALNVLIAAGVLIKVGKMVKKNLTDNKININSNRIDIENIKINLKSKKNLIKSKKSDLRKKKKNLLILKSLIERNKKSNDEKLVNFPFLVIQPTIKQFTHLNMTMQSNKQKLCISSNHQINFYGDLEIISILKDDK